MSRVDGKGAGKKNAQAKVERCVCGSIYAPAARFCQKCGLKKPDMWPEEVDRQSDSVRPVASTPTAAPNRNDVKLVVKNSFFEIEAENSSDDERPRRNREVGRRRASSEPPERTLCPGNFRGRGHDTTDKFDCSMQAQKTVIQTPTTKASTDEDSEFDYAYRYSLDRTSFTNTTATPSLQTRDALSCSEDSVDTAIEYYDNQGMDLGHGSFDNALCQGMVGNFGGFIPEGPPGDFSSFSAEDGLAQNYMPFVLPWCPEMMDMSNAPYVLVMGPPCFYDEGSPSERPWSFDDMSLPQQTKKRFANSTTQQQQRRRGWVQQQPPWPRDRGSIHSVRNPPAGVAKGSSKGLRNRFGMREPETPPFFQYSQQGDTEAYCEGKNLSFPAPPQDPNTCSQPGNTNSSSFASGRQRNPKAANKTPWQRQSSAPGVVQLPSIPAQDIAKKTKLNADRSANPKEAGALPDPCSSETTASEYEFQGDLSTISTRKIGSDSDVPAAPSVQSNDSTIQDEGANENRELLEIATEAVSPELDSAAVLLRSKAADLSVSAEPSGQSNGDVTNGGRVTKKQSASEPSGTNRRAKAKRKLLQQSAEAAASQHGMATMSVEKNGSDVNAIAESSAQSNGDATQEVDCIEEQCVVEAASVDSCPDEKQDDKSNIDLIPEPASQSHCDSDVAQDDGLIDGQDEVEADCLDKPAKEKRRLPPAPTGVPPPPPMSRGLRVKPAAHQVPHVTADMPTDMDKHRSPSSASRKRAPTRNATPVPLASVQETHAQEKTPTAQDGIGKRANAQHRPVVQDNRQPKNAAGQKRSTHTEEQKSEASAEPQALQRRQPLRSKASAKPSVTEPLHVASGKSASSAASRRSRGGAKGKKLVFRREFFCGTAETRLAAAILIALLGVVWVFIGGLYTSTIEAVRPVQERDMWYEFYEQRVMTSTLASDLEVARAQIIADQLRANAEQERERLDRRRQFRRRWRLWL